MALDDEIRQLCQSFWNLATTHGLTVSALESCTGGMLAAALTDLSGSSRYFRGGVVAYDNAIKTDLLGVESSCLLAHGAVSKETVGQMAAAGPRIFGTTLAVAVSGIAGPSGGSTEKPVGTVWLACVANPPKRSSLVTRHFVFGGTRYEVRKAAVKEALRLLIDCGNEVVRV